MTFYNVMTRKQIANNECDTSFEAACQRMGLTYERIIIDELRLDDIPTMSFDSNSLLYRMSTSKKASAVESILVMAHPGTFTTLYYGRSNPFKDRPFSELNEQVEAGLSVIPTKILDETWLKMTKDEVVDKINKIGGFPVVLKTLGLSHGKGVTKVDSAEQFMQSLPDMALNEYGTIARKYLADYRHYRLIVVENEVVAAIEYHKPENDFRTNAATPVVSALDVADLSESVLKLATESTQLRASLLAGVDILIDQTDNVAYLAEVNSPCYFARAEKPTGIDIAGKIIEALRAKQAKGKA